MRITIPNLKKEETKSVFKPRVSLLKLLLLGGIGNVFVYLMSVMRESNDSNFMLSINPKFVFKARDSTTVSFN